MGRSTLVGLGLAAVLFLAAPLVRAEMRLAFVKPHAGATVAGKTPVELQVDAPPEALDLKVEILVDGRPLTTLSAAPWLTIWDAGDPQPHQLEARLLSGDAVLARASVRTSELRIHAVERVELVNLFPIVVDREGRYVTGLTRDEFRVFEDGRPQQVKSFAVERKPLRVALVLDASASMARDDAEKLRAAQRAALEFLEVLEPGDEALVAAFNDNVEFLAPSTADRGKLVRAIEGLQARGGTALYDAVWRGAHALQGFDGRRVLVLLSDGKDEAYDGLGPGSLHTLREALDETLRSEVIVYAIGLGKGLEKQCVFSTTPLTPGLTECPEGTVAEVLQRVASTTGGRALLSPGVSRLRESFRDVAEDLRNQYALSYVSDTPSERAGWREIRVAVTRRDLAVRCRRGYFAGTASSDAAVPPAGAGASSRKDGSSM